jgi:Uncharacterised protein family (UPF0158)
VAKVKLRDIIDALESAGEEHSFWLDQETGDVHMLTDEMMDYAEEETALDEIPESMHEPVEVARRVQEDTVHRYLELPGKMDIHDWDIMDCFTSTIKDERVQGELRNGIRGAGASRVFKHLLEQHDLWKTWNKFREARLREIAIGWCEDNGIAWREK